MNLPDQTPETLWGASLMTLILAGMKAKGWIKPDYTELGGLITAGGIVIGGIIRVGSGWSVSWPF